MISDRISEAIVQSSPFLCFLTQFYYGQIFISESLFHTVLYTVTRFFFSVQYFQQKFFHYFLFNIFLLTHSRHTHTHTQGV